MKFFNSFAAAIIALAVIPAAAHAEKVVTRTTHTHTESFKKEHSWVYAPTGLYVAGQVGYNDPNGDFLNENAVYAGAVGYHVTPDIRAEVEYSYRRNDVDGGALISGRNRVQLLTANAWYDFKNVTAFTPYLGGGVGVARAKAIGNVPLIGFTTSSQDNAFAYQLGAGVSYALCKNMDLTADYRYINTNSFDDIGDDYKASEFRGGVRYNF